MLDPDWQLPMVNGLKLRCASDRRGEEEPNVVASQADGTDPECAMPCGNGKGPVCNAEQRNRALPSSNILTLNVGPTRTSECTSSENPDSAPSGVNIAGPNRAMPRNSKELSKWPQLRTERADPRQDTPRSSRGASRLAAPGTNNGKSGCAKPVTERNKLAQMRFRAGSGLSKCAAPNASGKIPVCMHPAMSSEKSGQARPRKDKHKPELAKSRANAADPGCATLRRDKNGPSTAQLDANDANPT